MFFFSFIKTQHFIFGKSKQMRLFIIVVLTLNWFPLWPNHIINSLYFLAEAAYPKDIGDFEAP